MDPNIKPNFDFSSAPAGEGVNGGALAPAFTSGAPESNGNYDSAAVPDGQTVPVETVDHGGYKGVHPIAAFFHAAFKLAAILLYIFGSTFGMGYVVLLVITIVLLAADFWTTKNVTGRILVSMRWRNEVKDDGSTEWLFESSPEADRRVNAYDNWFFWVLLIGNVVAWVVLLLLNLFAFKWLPIKLAAIILGGANLYGYFKCRRDAQQRVANFVLTQAVNCPRTAGQMASFFMGSGASNAPAVAVPVPPTNA